MLKTVVTATGAAVTNDRAHAQEKDHEHEHSHQAVPSDPAFRVKSLESLLVEKGLVDRSALDALIDSYEHKIGPRAMARVSWRMHGLTPVGDKSILQRVCENAPSLQMQSSREKPVDESNLITQEKSKPYTQHS